MSVILQTETELIQSQGLLEVISTYSGLPKPADASAIVQKNTNYILQYDKEGKIIQKRDVNPYLILDEKLNLLTWVDTEIDNFPNEPKNIGSISLPYCWKVKNSLYSTFPNLISAHQIPEGVRIESSGVASSSVDAYLFSSLHNYIERTISGNLPSSYFINLEVTGKLIASPGITSKIFLRNSSLDIMFRVIKPSYIQLNHEIFATVDDVPFSLSLNNVPMGLNTVDGTVRVIGISFPSNVPTIFELYSVKMLIIQ
jgi:hypothetical protein